MSQTNLDQQDIDFNEDANAVTPERRPNLAEQQTCWKSPDTTMKAMQNANQFNSLGGESPEPHVRNFASPSSAARQDRY